MKLCDASESYSLNDIGCGYGALVGFLAKRKSSNYVDYLGVDLVPAMARRARSLWRNQKWARFSTSDVIPRPADYCVASGIFNVKLQTSNQLWEIFVTRTLADMHANSRLGFAVNFMIDDPDRSGAEANLYRTRPEKWADHCENEFGSSVVILDKYGQNEFTLLARKHCAIHSR